MKHLAGQAMACVLIWVLVVGGPATAQQNKPVEPETMGVVYLLDSTDQSLKPLPKETPRRFTGGKGFAGVNTFVQIPESASSLRVKSGKDLEFIVKSSNPEGIHLYSFITKGKNRQALVGTSSPKGFRGVSIQQVGQIQLDVTKYGDLSYRLVMKAPAVGEYGFVVGWDVFDFAVDPN